MRISLKTKIWITVLTIVLLFAFFILFYFPAQQEKHLLNNYNKEVQNLANTVALGVKIALIEQNFEGVQTAMDFVKEDPHLSFVSLIQTDTIWNEDSTKFTTKNNVFKTYPENVIINPAANYEDSLVVKNAVFNTPMMNGQIMLGFTTSEIEKNKKQIRITSLIVSLVVFVIGILIGFWLARNISIPVLALRDAANKVGEGDLTQRVTQRTRDEIGELGNAFNKMVDDLARAQKQVREEKKKSDELLLNILPSETADELKATGSAKAKNYESVTVLFADFKSFTKLSEQLTPEQLVAELNYFFTQFDMIVEKYNIEKIKTIGDAYMCAGGLPVQNNSHPYDVVNAAMEMREVVNEYNRDKLSTSGTLFEMRVGINTGPVVAGIVGLRKFAYDIWGDTVNIASRMETASEPGRINISGSTYEQIRDRFVCTYRGKVSAKNKGEIDMYFVDDTIMKPADKKVHFEAAPITDFAVIERDVLEMLNDRLPGHLSYHNIEHTKDVLRESMNIALEEGVQSLEDLLLLKVAALYHDTGFMHVYGGHEEISCEIAKQQLPGYGFNNDQIHVVCDMIMATKIPQTPTSYLGEILCDADLDYLGRSDFYSIGHGLYLEFLHQGIVKNEIEWNQLQVRFLEKHSYFTTTSKNKRESVKKKHVEEVRKKIPLTT